ncbi:MAG: hypothetical protein NXI04_15180 [Planctomycetaceae bacterium]|nr:hypothetical protein [Planctomycetaceae bacterium]
MDEYNPATNRWTEKSFTPLELHHFQAVPVGEEIYLIGAMTGPYPRETPLEQVVIYHPERDTFRMGHTIPVDRRRGAAGAAFHEGQIYLAGGITNGHVGGFVPWLDRYDPQTGDWERLADAPHSRDHFQAVIFGDRLYAAAGRTTSQATRQVFELTEPIVDVYDLNAGRWCSLVAPLPTPRAGNMAFSWQQQLIIGGGEAAQKTAFHEVEAFSPGTNSWTAWPSLQTGRHGSGFAVIGDYVYTASGCGNRGGSPELTTLERLKLPR